MVEHKVVSQEEWIKARKGLLAKEKQLTRMRDELSAERRALAWVRVDKQYVFEGSKGKETLSDLFDGRSQLVVYHFMFGPDWDEPCPSCSFWADNFNNIIVHLNQRDVTFVAISRGPLKKLQAFAKRLGWSFKWLSSAGSDFNFDYHVSFREDDLAKGRIYHNYEVTEDPKYVNEEMPGVSVFYKDSKGDIFHTYSAYARGIDMVNNAYHYLDLVPKGRDESGLPHTMTWVRLRDEYAS
jgi:predicted dithiol-disulfide oxidoreductase (DUF899 family)